MSFGTHESLQSNVAAECLAPELASPPILQALLRIMPDTLADNQTYRNSDGSVLLLFVRERFPEGPNSLVSAVRKSSPDLSDEGLDRLEDYVATAPNGPEAYHPFGSDWAREALRDILIMPSDQLSEYAVPRELYNAEESRIQGDTSVI